MGRGGTPRTGGPGTHEAACVPTGRTQGSGKAGVGTRSLGARGCRMDGGRVLPGRRQRVWCGMPRDPGLGCRVRMRVCGPPYDRPGWRKGGGLQAVCARLLHLGLHKCRAAMRRPRTAWGSSDAILELSDGEPRCTWASALSRVCNLRCQCEPVAECDGVP